MQRKDWPAYLQRGQRVWKGLGWAGECYSSSVQCPGCARHKENQGKVTRARVVAARTSLKESKQLLYPPCPEALWSAAERAAGPQ